MKTKRRALQLLLTLLPLAFATALMADETEIYSAYEGSPNVLFLLDVSGSMRKTIDDGDGNTANDKTRMQVLKESFSQVMSTAPEGINIGLMHYANHGLGNDYWWSSVKGVNVPVLPIDSQIQDVIAPYKHNDNLPDPTGTTTVRQFLASVVNDWGGTSSYVEGYTPIVDALYEASRYFKGDAVAWGRDEPIMGWAAHPMAYADSVTCKAGKSTQESCVKTWGECNASVSNCTSESYNVCCNWVTTGGDGSGYCENNDYTCSTTIETCQHSVCTEFEGTPAYKSPIKNKCQPSYLVLMSDGKPEYPYYPGATEVDGTHYYPPSSARYPGNSTVGATTGYAADRTDHMNRHFSQKVENYLGIANTACVDGVDAAVGYKSGTCGPEITHWLANTDLSTALGTDKKETVKTYTIGFAMQDEPKGKKYLELLAQQGNGEFFTANNTSELVDRFNEILDEAGKSVTFTSPSYAVNQNTLLSHSSDVYIPVSQPGSATGWEGNLKKFTRNAEGVIVNENGTPAFTEQGEATEATDDVWGPAGEEVSAGGAASQLPAPDDRKLYTDVSSSTDLTATSNALTVSNTSITDALLMGINETTNQPKFWLPDADGDGTSCLGYYFDCAGVKHNVLGNYSTKVGCVNIASVTAACPGTDYLTDAQREQYIEFARGETPVTGEPRQHMGDILNSKPVVLSYADEQRIFVATNEGFLHSIDTTEGEEQWAFMPKSLLDNIRLFYNQTPSNEHMYGIDGPITPWLVDWNGNGKIEKYSNTKDNNEDGLKDTNDDDKAYLFFGLRRGGKAYYALDVTEPDKPLLKWKYENVDGVDDNEWDELGETWSKPALAKMRTGSSTSNTLKTVLVFGAGYDAAKDEQTVANRIADGAGRDVMIVDALDGTLLWSLRNDVNGADDLLLHSIPGDIRVMDMDRNGALDRLYFSDTGGNIWRVDMDHDLRDSDADMYNYDDAKLTKIAALGTSSDNTVDPRKFFYEPDVALIQHNGQSLMTISIGSGYRTHPLNTATNDRFYVLMEPNVYNEPPSNFAAITNTDLTVHSNADLDLLKQTYKGWYYDFSLSGEKVLAPAVTFLNKALFTTFAPVDENGNPVTVAAESCAAPVSSARAYILDLFTGKPVANLDGNTTNGTSGKDEFVVAGINEILNSAQIVFRPPEYVTGDDGSVTGCTDGCQQTVEIRVGKMSVPLMDEDNSNNAGSKMSEKTDLTDIIPRIFWRDNNVSNP